VFVKRFLLLGVALAAAGWGCGGPEHPPTAASAADTADQVVFGLNHQLTMDGVLRTRVQADTAYFYQISQKVLMRHIKVTFYSLEGTETSTLTGDGGVYEWRTGNMEARGNVVAVTPDHRKLTTSVLNYQRDSQSIVGPEAFVFDSPERHLEGDGFTSDPDFKNVVTRKPKRGTIGKVELQP
jgi:LPS export ABC transporter protein LptC